MNEFLENNNKLIALVTKWEPILLSLSEELITNVRNNQKRTIKQIVGHMVDSASNNGHRIIHLQYQPSPLVFPDYANSGNNDKWIAIQNYQSENWFNLVLLWKYANLHFAHIVSNLNPDHLDNTWISGIQETVTLKEMALDYLNHFNLHLREIEELMDQN